MTKQRSNSDALSEPVLKVENLSIDFRKGQHSWSVVNDISLSVDTGKTLGIVGESGCGKSLTALSIMNLLPKPDMQIAKGKILFKNKDLRELTTKQWRSVRGKKIAMIFQEPMTALNPVQKIGQQITEVFRLHQPQMTPKQQRAKAIDLLDKVGISEPTSRIDAYPHQLSGGMRQRAMIAMALSCDPDILIADEPTTALDVTVQAQILELIDTLKKQNNMSVILITHNLGIVAQYCDEVAVMYAGKVVEQASTKALFKSAYHPYTRDLLGSMPQLAEKSKTQLPSIAGRVPDILHMPKGCRYNNRCRFVIAGCKKTEPKLESCYKTHRVSCIRWQEVKSHD